MERRIFELKQFKKISALLLAVCVVLGLASCSKKEIPNPTPESVIDSFYTAWEKSDAKTIVSLTCEPMWEVEAKSAEIAVDELKTNLRQIYAEESGSDVYYKILKTTQYKETDEEYENIYNWAKERYDIEIEGYAVVRVAVTYDNGEPVTQNMDVIKYEDNWYARDLLGI